jgi:phosphate transport system substrate-binding protein
MWNKLITFISILLITACGGSSTSESEKESAPGLTGKVRIDGSSTVFPISEAVAEEFNAVAPGVRVTVGVSGTGGGFKKFINKETDISDASRSIKTSEIEHALEAGINFIELPVAFDGLSVVTNSKNDWARSMTTAELKQIWEPGSLVKTWSQVRPEWPNEKIRLYGPGTDSGTFDYFTKVINGREQASRADFTASEDDNVLVQGVAGDLYSLGYFGYAYYKENQDKLNIVAIDGGAGPVLPTEKTINNGTYAPLSRPIFIYINADSLDDPAVAEYVDFYIENAGVLASEVGYIPLQDSTYAAAKERIDSREFGTAYKGEDRVSTLIAHLVNEKQLNE